MWFINYYGIIAQSTQVPFLTFAWLLTHNRRSIYPPCPWSWSCTISGEYFIIYWITRTKCLIFSSLIVCVFCLCVAFKQCMLSNTFYTIVFFFVVFLFVWQFFKYNFLHLHYIYISRHDYCIFFNIMLNWWSIKAYWSCLFFKLSTLLGIEEFTVIYSRRIYIQDN